MFFVRRTSGSSFKNKDEARLCTILGQKEEIIRFANDLVVRVNCSNYLSTRNGRWPTVTNDLSKGLCNFELQNFSSPVFSAFPWMKGTQLWNFLGRCRIRNSSFFRRLKIISDTFNIQLATRFEAMIEIMKRFNVEIYKTIAVIQSRILLTWTLYRLCFALFFLLEKVLIRWRIKKNYNKLYFPFFPKKKHFKFNNMYFKILGIFILLYQKN